MANRYMNGLIEGDKQDWGTPQAFFEYIENEFNVQFTLDACASDYNTKCLLNYYTEQNDGLTQDWHGEVWCNPPYARVIKHQFIRKAANEAGLGNARVFCLIPARTDTKLFHDVIMKEAAAVYFIKGRLNFEHNRRGMGSAPFASMLVIFDGIIYGDGPTVSVLSPSLKERGF
jgi:phage N-6-adenine-methyltransferase